MKKLFSFISTTHLQLSPSEKIIPSEDFLTLCDAKETLEKALIDKETLRNEATEEAIQIKEKAQEEGYLQGLEKFHDHILGLEEKVRKIHLDTQTSILKIALQAAKKICAKELELHPETIVDIVLQALAPVKQNHKIMVFVNKTDKDILEANKPRIKEIFEQLHFLGIQEREGITPGGCMIETESGIINATLENQWKALEAAFNRYSK